MLWAINRRNVSIIPNSSNPDNISPSDLSHLRHVNSARIEPARKTVHNCSFGVMGKSDLVIKNDSLTLVQAPVPQPKQTSIAR